MKNELIKICEDLGIDCVGVSSIGPFHELEELLTDRINKGEYTGFEERDLSKRIDPSKTMEDIKSIIVCLFPYYTGYKGDSNISKYTFSKDYHLVVKDKLENIATNLSERIKGFSYQSYVDTGPLVDRYLAYQAGLGFFGINSHLITEKYGSYVFIGYILNNYPFEFDKPLDKTCYKCFKCVKMCPGNIIKGNFDINPMKCKSFLTQKKEELTAEETGILKKTNLVFGCDVCQEVCPHNLKIHNTDIKEFKENLIYNLDYDEISDMSNKGFKREYKDKAFSWRGRKVIKRNFEIINKK